MNLIRLLICALVAALGPCVSLAANTPAPETQATYTPPSAQPFSHEELDQLVAPIALYSDALLAQVLMASTYPLEVVEAERWVKENSTLKGEALLSALDKERWDASVKALAQVPAVLHMMSDKLDWTQKLGDAFLAQQKDVMDAVQRLRHMADKAGNLKSDKHQKVVHRGASSPPAYAPPPASGSGGTSVVEQIAPSGGDTIIIEQTSPVVVYVPDYNPEVAYGAWPYPAYPPYYWGAGYWGGYGYPYAPLGGALAWGVGWGVSAAIWNNAFDWHGGNVYNNYYNSWGANRWNNHHGNWSHNVNHRRGVNYRDQATRDRFSRGDRNVAAREQFRGRGDARGREGLGGRDGARGQTPRLSERDMNRRNDRGNRAADRGRQGARGQTPKLSNRDMNRGNRGASDRGRAQNRARDHNRQHAQRGNRGGYDRGRAGNRQQAQRGRGGYNRSAQQRMGGNRGNYGRGGYSSPRQANRQSFGGNRYGGSYGGGRGYSGGRGGFDGVGRGGASRSFSSRGGGSRGGMRGGGGRRGR